MKPERPGDPGRMLIGRHRLFYSGRADTFPINRCLGSLTLYAAPDGALEFSIDNSVWHRHVCVAVAPSVPHRIRACSDRILTVFVEAETISPEAIEGLLHESLWQPQSAEHAARLVKADEELAGWSACPDFSAKEFDDFFLGCRLETSNLDPRISLGIDRLQKDLIAGDEATLVGELAEAVGLSTSRFVHLFKEQTGLTYRSHRAWKRARRFMDYVTCSKSLTSIALDLGYPDSSHFSHSIRKTFGQPPRSMRHNLRGLRLFIEKGYQLATEMT